MRIYGGEKEERPKIKKGDSTHNSQPLFWNKNSYACICDYIEGWHLIQ